MTNHLFAVVIYWEMTQCNELSECLHFPRYIALVCNIMQLRVRWNVTPVCMPPNVGSPYSKHAPVLGVHLGTVRAAQYINKYLEKL